VSVQPQPWPEPDPQIAVAIRAMYRGKREVPLAVQVRDRFGELFPDAEFAEAFGRRGRSWGSPPRQIGRILTGADLKPHLVRGWLTRPADPQFFDKAADVCAVYRTLPAEQWCSRWTRRPGSLPGPPRRPRPSRAAGPPRVRVRPPRHRIDHRCT
jgi:hypothetical protein